MQQPSQVIKMYFSSGIDGKVPQSLSGKFNAVRANEAFFPLSLSRITKYEYSATGEQLYGYYNHSLNDIPVVVSIHQYATLLRACL